MSVYKYKVKAMCVYREQDTTHDLAEYEIFRHDVGSACLTRVTSEKS